MGNQKKIKAMKNGMEGWFSEFDWRVGNPEKHGWKKIGEADAIDGIPAKEFTLDKKEIEVVEIEDDDPAKDVVKEVVVEEKDYPSDDEIREYLNGLAEQGKIKKPHHATGQKKLRKLYDENTK